MKNSSMFDRTPSPQTMSWFLDLHEGGQLNLTPPYQRRSVWSSKYREFFIDSVFRNFPTQSIFLEKVVIPDVPTEYRVLDGKQRLTSIISFVNGEFPVPDSLEDMNISGKYYSDLSREEKLKVYNYVFTVEFVVGAANTVLNDVFNRLNKNVAKLNRQELRNAQFDGEFAEEVNKLVDNSLWERIGLVTEARVRRMLDAEYVSELYIICASGIQDGKDYLDEYYAKWDEEIPESKSIRKRFDAVANYVGRLDEILSLSRTRFSNVADLYSLWAAIIRLIDGNALPDYETAASRLASFETELEDAETERARKYMLAARQGSNKASNRTIRADIIASVLSGEGK